MSSFKPGDVVRLKSGGPDMTVTAAKASDGRLYVWTTWFDQTTAKTGHFPSEAVQLAADVTGPVAVQF